MPDSTTVFKQRKGMSKSLYLKVQQMPGLKRHSLSPQTVCVPLKSPWDHPQLKSGIHTANKQIHQVIFLPLPCCLYLRGTETLLQLL